MKTPRVWRPSLIAAISDGCSRFPTSMGMVHGTLLLFSPNLLWYQKILKFLLVLRIWDIRRNPGCPRPRDLDRWCCPWVLLIALISKCISCINSSFNAAIALSCETAAILPFLGRISCTLSATSAIAVKDLSNIPAMTCWVETGSRVIQRFCRKSSLTDVPVRFYKWRKNWDGVRSPIPSPSSHFLTRMLLKSVSLLISAVFRASYWPSSSGFSMTSSTSYTYFGSRFASTYPNFVESRLIPAIENCASSCLNQSNIFSGQKVGTRIETAWATTGSTLRVAETLPPVLYLLSQPFLVFILKLYCCTTLFADIFHLNP